MEELVKQNVKKVVACGQLVSSCSLDGKISRPYEQLVKIHIYQRMRFLAEMFSLLFLMLFLKIYNIETHGGGITQNKSGHNKMKGGVERERMCRGNLIGRVEGQNKGILRQNKGYGKE